MLDNTLFYVIFISQIILLSYYIPARFITRINKVITLFPAEEYPKLYPKGINYFQRQKRWFSIMNWAILILGFVVMYFIHLWAKSDNGEVNPMFPWAYFMLQLLPVLLLEQSGFKQFREMREEDSRTRRHAEMVPRKLFDFVSPGLFWSAIMAYLLFVLFIFAVHDFNVDIDGKPVLMSLIVLAGNIIFAGIIVFLLYGKKLDPYQDNKDRTLKIKYSITPLMYVSIAVSVYAGVQVAINQFNLDFLEPIMMSIYCQLITLVTMTIQLNNIRIEDLNFEVYKKDTAGN